MIQSSPSFWPHKSQQCLAAVSLVVRARARVRSVCLRALWVRARSVAACAWACACVRDPVWSFSRLRTEVQIHQ